MVLIKILVVLNCGAIALQDFKERAVMAFLFPTVGILLAINYLYNATWNVYLLFVGINVLLVSLILFLLYLYTKWVIRKPFLNVSFGLGDLFFFYALALGFPTVTFILLFVGALLFSLLVLLFAKMNNNMDTVPLAGLMGLFLMGILILSFFPNVPSLYIL
ncbi:hypothetical protein [Spongiimicrobium sp. 3-5]|uniref:hypothetical protein n=1 Tax=Spongiimicrobium sp. 3-5 TaxID=3332596 RepID=UPI0039818309